MNPSTGDVAFFTFIGFAVGFCCAFLCAIILYSADPGAGKDWDCKDNGKAAVVAQNSDFTTYGDVCVRKDES